MQGQEEVEQEGREGDQFSVLEVLVSVFRKSLVGYRSTSAESGGVERLMEIGWPTNVRHVAHVIFDRFNGFLGLPVEFEPEVPRRPPSARLVNVFNFTPPLNRVTSSIHFSVKYLNLNMILL